MGVKIGEIKIEALKAMGVNYGDDISVENLYDVYKDENYASYLVGMNGAINRALDRIQNACVVTVKSYEIPQDEITIGRAYDKFDTSAIDDLYIIDRIVAESNKSYNSFVPFEMQGKTILLPKSKDTDFTILYYPILKPVDDTVADTDEIWLPDNIARMIYLFIKGDLYEEDEPQLAHAARNQFEALLQELKQNNFTSRQTRIEKVI